MRKLFVYGLLTLASLARLQATTLLQLSLNDMIQQSSMIVRGKAQITNTSRSGPVIYTHYQVTVTSAFKGTPGPQVDVVVPGGVYNGVRQSLAGAPALVNGQDYVFFLWTSRSGLTQVIGLSQGLFRVVTNSSGQLMVTRAATTELMLNSSGQPVTDSDFQMTLSALVARIQSVLSGSGQ